MVRLQMGYNDNKELEVIIENALSNESVIYYGVNQSTNIGMSYPLTVKRPPTFKQNSSQEGSALN